MSGENVCFVVAPIGEEGSKIREHSDNLLNYVIEPAVSKHGYKAVRADKISDPGLITHQVIEHVVESPLVIADLTDNNPNVFYELAIRHAFQKPYIQLIDKSDDIPFDVADIRTIKIDLSDPGSVDEAKREIAKQIENIETDQSDISTPVSNALDLKELRDSSDPEERSMAEIMESLAKLRNEIITIRDDITNQNKIRLNDVKDVFHEEYIKSLNEEINSGNVNKALQIADELEVSFTHIFEYVEDDPSIDDEDIQKICINYILNINELRSLLRDNKDEGRGSSLNEF